MLAAEGLMYYGISREVNEKAGSGSIHGWLSGQSSKLEPGLVTTIHCRIGCWYGIWYSAAMRTARKITIEVPEDLLDRAQKASGAGITQTVRTGLQLVAASHTYARLRKLRGKVQFACTLEELKSDR